MGKENLWNISVQQVEIFLKAVELKNFTQVANELNFTPSMISKTIAFMEDELGIQLFIRKPHELTPTPAACFLAKEWKQFTGAFNHSIQKARAYQMYGQEKIILGFVDSSAYVDRLISQSICSYTAQNPHIMIAVEKHDMHRAAELLNHGMLDLIITNEMEVPYLEDHQLCWEKICDTGVSAYVPSHNPLFEKTQLTFEDLKDQSFLSLDAAMHPTYHTWLHRLCVRHGFVPDIFATFRTVRSLMFSLTMYPYLFIGNSITSDWCSEELKMFSLPEKSFSLAAWRSHSTKELLDFKNYLKEQYPMQF